MNRAEKHYVQCAHAASDALDRSLEALRACAPIGATVVWFWRGHRQYGTVVGYGNGERLRVRNATTGRVVVIGSWCLDFMLRGY